jgi:hypothetical protein
VCDLTTTFSEPVTVEGEQVILSLQVGRFLMKSVREVADGKTPKGSVGYLLEAPLTAADISGNLNSDGSVNPWTGKSELVVSMLRDRARRMAYKLEKKNSLELGTGKSFDEATNASALLAYKAAFCHSSFVMARNNLEALEKFIEDPMVKAALYRLLELQLLIQVRDLTPIPSYTSPNHHLAFRHTLHP